MNRSAPGAAGRDLTAKARIRNAALDLYAANGEDGTSLRTVATAAGVTVGLVVHHYGTKDGLREAVERLVVEHFATALASAPVDIPGADIARIRNDAVVDMLVRRPEVVNYLRRALLDPGGQRGELLERLTELTHREVIAMRESGAASRVRADAVQVVDVIVTQLGRLFLQPLVDSMWSHLGTFTHTEGDDKPELSVRVTETLAPQGTPQ